MACDLWVDKSLDQSLKKINAVPLNCYFTIKEKVSLKSLGQDFKDYSKTDKWQKINKRVIFPFFCKYRLIDMIVFWRDSQI